MYVFGIVFFKQVMNLIDLGLVVLSVVDTWILSFTSGSACGSSLRILMAVRILRILRVVRFFRLVRAFDQLWLIVSGLMSALQTVVWVMLFLGILIYMCAIFTTSQIGSEPYFGSVVGSMVSLWQVVALDSWADSIVRPLIVEAPLLVLFFVPFVFFTTFGIFNVILGIVVENTVRSANSQSEKQSREKEIERQVVLTFLRRVIELSDPDESGKVSRSEFEALWRVPEVRERLVTVLRIDLDEIVKIFESLGDPLETTELIAAIAQMTGSSFQKDLNQVLLVLEGLEARVRMAEDQLTEFETHINTLCVETNKFTDSTLYYLTGTK